MNLLFPRGERRRQVEIGLLPVFVVVVGEISEADIDIGEKGSQTVLPILALPRQVLLLLIQRCETSKFMLLSMVE